MFNVNTGARIDVRVQTPGGQVRYSGDARIDGVGGTAAAIHLNFLDAGGAVTGSVFPTGQRIDLIDGLRVTCIDAAMPMVLLRAADLGLTGHEAPDLLDASKPLLQKLKYDPIADFTPIGLVGHSSTLMVATANVPVKDVKDLVARLKARPDKYTYASAGNGMAPHFAAELFKLGAGVDGVAMTQWYATFAPGKTPKPIIDKLNKAINEVLTDNEIVKRIEDHGADVQSRTPDELATLVKTELAKWKRVVQAAKLTAQ